MTGEHSSDRPAGPTLYMIIEDFRNADPVPVYRRLRDQGRQIPDGLTYVSSWVTSDLARCYQVIECDDRALLDEWISQWDDLVEFEVVAVLPSAEASRVVEPRL